MCACFPVWLIERGYYIQSALNDTKIRGLSNGGEMTWGRSDCREGAKRCDKENQRGWGRGLVALSPALPPSFSPLSDFALHSTV